MNAKVYLHLATLLVESLNITFTEQSHQQVVKLCPAVSGGPVA
jgi:hypothetical protein